MQQIYATAKGDKALFELARALALSRPLPVSASHPSSPLPPLLPAGAPTPKHRDPAQATSGGGSHNSGGGEGGCSSNGGGGGAERGDEGEHGAALGEVARRLCRAG